VSFQERLPGSGCRRRGQSELELLAKRIRQADLVVMGTVSRTGIPGLLIGNTAEVILNNLECSVLAVKPADFATPVSFSE